MKTDNQNNKNSWEIIQEKLADKTGLAVIVVEGENSEIISKSNNNSICELLYTSAEFSPKCAMFCGKAFQMATEAGKSVEVKCHANLNFSAVPITANERQLVAIVGRTFLKSEDYKTATERAMAGDWQQFPTEELFKNVLLSSSINEIGRGVKLLEKLTVEEKHLLSQVGKIAEEITATVEVVESTEHILQPPPADEITKLIEQFHQTSATDKILSNEISEKQSVEMVEIAEWRSLFSSLLDLSYKEACISVLRFVSKHYQIASLAWLERKNNNFETIWASGNFRGQQIQITISADDTRLFEAIQKETSVEFRERKASESYAKVQNVNLFPIAVGGTVRSAVVVGDELPNENVKRHIARFMRYVASDLEILRLREEIERQSWITKAIQRMNEILKQIDSDDFWTVLAQVSAELMRAEQGSLLLFDEDTKEFTVKATIGSRADKIKKELPSNLGKRVAQSVLKSGKPLVVKDTSKIGLKTPTGWEYKTNSFISYPMIIGGRTIGVLNVTDKIDGGSYNETDLELLNTFIPQIAVAIDRKSLMRKTGELVQLSITDPLTNLVNRRYLEERMTEEVNRSQRHGYPLSFMMIDVDSFKNYNDTFGHTAGDTALQIVAQCLKATLRGADVAARYGGEEFSILLPQTTSMEALTIAERLRVKIATTSFPNTQVTVSIGVATCSNALKTPQELIAAADTALYDAKRNGRNNVQLYQKKNLANDLVNNQPTGTENKPKIPLSASGNNPKIQVNK